MTDKSIFTIPAIGEIDDPSRIRVVIFVNNQMIHAPLEALLAHLVQQIADLEQRVSDLEALHA